MEKNPEVYKPDGNKHPIINCHTHIFTGDHVAPWLAKTVVPKPFCFFFPLWLFVGLFRFWYKYPARIVYTPFFKKLSQGYVGFQTAFNKLGIFRTIIEYYITMQVFFSLYRFITPVFPTDKTIISDKINDALIWLTSKGLLWSLPHWTLWPLLLIVYIFLPSGRNLVLFIFKHLWAILRKMPGKQTKEVFHRYLNIGRFAFHKKQSSTLYQLKRQYPEDAAMVVLPMDMEYMAAGKPCTRFRDQMEDLVELKSKPANKNELFPFVFIDPRRIVNQHKEKRSRSGDKVFFDYDVVNGKVVLKDCFVRYLIEEKKFSGFKIYPALGYYPFEPALLAVWKYAADNGLPILTHCVTGPMYYRGKKKSEWNFHPIFKQANGKEDKPVDIENAEQNETQTVYGPLSLPQLSNNTFTANFTHPMNFLCLLEKEWLRMAVNQGYKQTGDKRLIDIFGLSPADKDEEATIQNGLGHLKICLGHFGGGDQWERYFEKDRYSFSNELTQSPYSGIDFLNLKGSTERSFGKPELLWKYTDWYSIICSMMLQHPNVYADISYILHSHAEILPLLKQTLQNSELRKKVLYGTDFYVVRNHKSDKNMLADMMGGLSEDDFDQIARANPRRFLNL
jgi:predicted TIM-barrel fold metal-dependent hydrolase